MKPNRRSLFMMLLFMGVFTISGIFFIIAVAFGLFGLSRLLIYFHLAEFTYNQSQVDNLFYYGSYILGGYFLLVCIEYTLDALKKRYSEFYLFIGWRFHVMIIVVSTLAFYLIIHVNYTYIHINFFVIFVIIALLYALTELFYPESTDLNDIE